MFDLIQSGIYTGKTPGVSSDGFVGRWSKVRLYFVLPCRTEKTELDPLSGPGQEIDLNLLDCDGSPFPLILRPRL